MFRCFLVAFAVLLICVCAYEDPESNLAGIADDEDAATAVTGELGHPLHVRCLTSEKPTLFVLWYLGDKRTTWLYNNSVYKMTGNALLIRSLAIETLGQYTCQVYSSEGMEAPRLIKVRAYRPDGLFIENEWLVPRSSVASKLDTTTEAPEDLFTEKQEVAASESGIAILRCQFESTKLHSDPSTKISWKFGEHKIDGTSGRYRLKSDGALEIVSLYRNDTGVYICLADNGVEVAKQEIHLVVNGPVRIPAEIAGEDNATVTGELEQSLHVRCLAYGYPKPSVFWTRGGIVLYNDLIYEVTENVLTIRSLSIDTLGPYTCRAYNDAGRVASWGVVVQAYRPEGLIIENEWLVPRDMMAPRPSTQPSTDIWLFTDKVYDCNKYLVNCSRLRCDYGVQRVHQPDGCEKCSCVQVEIDCEPVEQECIQLKCNYGHQRVRQPDGCEKCTCMQVEIDCEPLEQECIQLNCNYGIERVTGPDGCEKCSCVQAEIDCEPLEQECIQLKCNYGHQRVRQPDGCEKCTCMQVEIDCEPLEQECIQLNCNYGIERVTGPDGCEKCSCVQAEIDCEPLEQECIQLKCDYSHQRVRQPGGCEKCSCIQVEIDCEPLEQECIQLKCNYGIERVTGPDGCEKCSCVQVEINCEPLQQDCIQLKCNYGIERVTGPDGCEKCSCVQFEIDCEPFQQECIQLQCNYGIERVTGSDGCERCRCKEYPCERKSCAAGERCEVHQYENRLKPEIQFTAECRTIVKAGACPMDETTTNEVMCRRECADDAHCRGDGKCCRRGCSDICLVPVERTSPNPLLISSIAPDPVKIPVTIVGDQNATVIGELGQPVSVRCQADGYPPPAVFWYFGFEEIMVPYYNADYIARGNTLLFRNLTIKNLGQYTCHAYNGEDKEATWSVTVRAYMPEGLFIENEFIVPRTQSATAAETTTKTWSTTEPFTLILTLPVKAHMVTPFSTLNLGADLRLTCEVDGLPEPDVHWTKDGANIQPDARITVTGNTAVSRLTVTRVTDADSGLYACHASNPYSSQSDTAQINVLKLIVPTDCTDNAFFAPCDLIVRSKFCRHKYYSKFCCKSCVEAGQLDAQDLEQMRLLDGINYNHS